MQRNEETVGLPRNVEVSNLYKVSELASGEELWAGDVQFFHDDGSLSSLFKERLFVEMPGDCVFIAGAENPSCETDLAPTAVSAEEQRLFLLAMATADIVEPIMWRIFTGWEYRRQLATLRAYCAAKAVSIDVGVGYRREDEYVLERLATPADDDASSGNPRES